LWAAKKRRCSTSPSKVYPKGQVTADFLLCAGSINLDPEASEVGLELFGRFEDNSGHPQAGGRLCVGRNVVDINGFLRPHLTSPKSLAVDDGVRFACADPVGIDANGEKAEEGEASFLMGHVDGIGIRKQGQLVILGKVLQERLGMNGVGVQGAVPDFTELLESK